MIKAWPRYVPIRAKRMTTDAAIQGRTPAASAMILPAAI